MEDLGINSTQYSIALTVTYVPYIVAELPLTLAIRKVLVALVFNSTDSQRAQHPHPDSVHLLGSSHHVPGLHPQLCWSHRGSFLPRRV